jgi:YgiT-type zinc finger domain-containing protein
LQLTGERKRRSYVLNRRFDPVEAEGDFDPGPGISTGGVGDGLCVDDEGCVWVAMWGGAQVRRYGPDGRLLTIVPVACCFAGPDRTTLVVMSAREGLSRRPTGHPLPAAPGRPGLILDPDVARPGLWPGACRGVDHRPMGGFGLCPCGGGEYERRRVEVRMTIKDRVVVLRDVPSGACLVCGSRVYAAEVLRCVEAAMTGRPWAVPAMPGSRA